LRDIGIACGKSALNWKQQGTSSHNPAQPLTILSHMKSALVSGSDIGREESACKPCGSELNREPAGRVLASLSPIRDVGTRMKGGHDILNK